MKITKALKQYLLAKGWVGADDPDEKVSQTVMAKLMSGELDAKKLAELQDEQGQAKNTVQQIIADAIAPLAETVKTLQISINQGGKKDDDGKDDKKKDDKKDDGKKDEKDPVAVEVNRQMAEFMKTLGLTRPAGDDGGSAISPTQLFSRAAQSGWLRQGEVRVKSAWEGYDHTKSNLHWADNSKHTSLRGKRVTAPSMKGPGLGRPLESTSKAEEALIGAYFKWAVACNSPGEKLPGGLRMNDHDWDLLKYAMHELPWHGVVGGENGQPVDGVRLTDGHRKALLDDSTSGGIYAAPLVLDDAIIQQPLLYGELFPLVDVVNLTQGRRIEAFTMGRPSFTSGIAESTAIPLLDTTNFIGALDTVIQNAVGSMELGNDFEEDSPANIGQMVIAAYGEAALQWLDMVIAVGDGVTQPKGVFSTAGVTTVASASGAAGPLTVGDLEGLMFGVNKAFRTSRGGRNIYLGNEVSYRRFRGIPTGSAYNTRAFGMNYGDYEILGFPYKIQTSIPNNKIAFFNAAYYRMYRRLGTQFRVERGGKELTQRNVTLIAVRMRYGGQMTLGGAAAVMTDGQT